MAAGQPLKNLGSMQGYDLVREPIRTALRSPLKYPIGQDAAESASSQSPISSSFNPSPGRHGKARLKNWLTQKRVDHRWMPTVISLQTRLYSQNGGYVRCLSRQARATIR